MFFSFHVSFRDCIPHFSGSSPIFQTPNHPLKWKLQHKDHIEKSKLMQWIFQTIFLAQSRSEGRMIEQMWWRNWEMSGVKGPDFSEMKDPKSCRVSFNEPFRVFGGMVHKQKKHVVQDSPIQSTNPIHTSRGRCPGPGFLWWAFFFVGKKQNRVSWNKKYLPLI